MFQIFFVYILIQSVLSNGLTNHDLCMKDTNTECNAMHSYECKPNKCSISERVCDDFKRLEYVLSSFRSRRTYDVQMNKLSEFKKLIKKCPHHKYEWRANDYCLNNRKCIAFEFNVITRTNDKTIIDCPCSAKYPNKCSRHICSIEGTKCNQLFNKTFASSYLVKKIRACPNVF